MALLYLIVFFNDEVLLKLDSLALESWVVGRPIKENPKNTKISKNQYVETLVQLLSRTVSGNLGRYRLVKHSRWIYCLNIRNIWKALNTIWEDHSTFSTINFHLAFSFSAKIHPESLQFFNIWGHATKPQSLTLCRSIEWTCCNVWAKYFQDGGIVSKTERSNTFNHSSKLFV